MQQMSLSNSNRFNNNRQTNFSQPKKISRSKTTRSERQYSYECKTSFDDSQCTGIMDKIIQAHLKRFENDIMLNEINFIFSMLSKTGDKRKSGVFVDRNTIDTMQKKLNQVERNLVSFRSDSKLNKSVSTWIDSSNRSENVANKIEDQMNSNYQTSLRNKQNYQNVENEENIINRSTKNLNKENPLINRKYSDQKNFANNQKYDRSKTARDMMNYNKGNEKYPESYKNKISNKNKGLNPESESNKPNKKILKGKITIEYNEPSRQNLSNNDQEEINADLNKNNININLIPENNISQEKLRNQQNYNKNISNYPEQSPNQNIQNPENYQQNINNNNNNLPNNNYGPQGFTKNPKNCFSPEDFPKNPENFYDSQNIQENPENPENNFGPENYPENYNDPNIPQNQYYPQNNNRGPGTNYQNYTGQLKNKSKNKTSTKNKKNPLINYSSNNYSPYKNKPGQNQNNYAPFSNKLEDDRNPQNYYYANNFPKSSRPRSGYPLKKRNLSLSKNSQNKNLNKPCEISYGYPPYSTCFACDANCSISRSGNSPNTYNPYFGSKKVPRKHVTYLKSDVVYEQYTRHKKTPEQIQKEMDAMYNY